MHIFFRLSLHFIKRKNSNWLNFSAIVSIIGIAFGVMSFLTVVTVLNAFQSQMEETIFAVNPNLTIFSPMGIADLKENEKKISTLLKTQIEQISPFIYQESILAHEKYTSAVYIRAITGTKSSSAHNLEKYIFPNTALQNLTIPNDIGPYHVILGKELAQNLKADLNSTVTLMTFEPQKNRSPKVKYTKLTVVGFLSVGLAQYDKNYLIMNFEDGQKLFGQADWASGFEIKLKKPDDALKLSYMLSNELPFSSMAWQEIDANLFKQITRDSTVIKFIVLIISMVSVFNILITLGLTVIDRTKQIALLRSLGAQKKQIVAMFVMVGTILGFLGACLGTALSLIILWCISEIRLGDLNQFYYLDKIPVQFSIILMIIVFIFAILLSAVGALYPAWRASKIKPILGLK